MRIATAHQPLSARWALALLLTAAYMLPAQAARLALVVGNASYTERPLKNPVNDATDLKKALEGAGFQVTLVLEANADKMKEAIAEFGDRLARENDVGLFYFSGHGVQTAKGNYLLPLGRSFQRERDVELFAVEARAVLDQMARARNPLNIVILDACRDSPLPATERSAGSKGLARMDAPSGSVIAYATAPGRTASDNSSGRNGLYTKHLINALSTEGLTLEAVFRRVGAAVERDNPDQSPEEVMKLRSEAPFYFRPPRGTPPDREYEQWAAASRANTTGAYVEYLRAYPSGLYAGAAKNALTALQSVETRQPESRPVAVAARVPSPVPTIKAAPATGLALVDGRYQLLSDGSEVKDTQTGLVWARCSIGQQWDGKTCAGQAESLTFDEAQRLASRAWRVPSVRELTSLIYCGSDNSPDSNAPMAAGEQTITYCDEAVSSPTIQANAFPNTPRAGYWSSSANARSPGYAWFVGFSFGAVGMGSQEYGGGRVRLVRTGQ